jgi:uncharacterized protein
MKKRYPQIKIQVRSGAVLIWSVSMLFLFSNNVIAASFDCNKSHTYIERAICSNKQLSNLDERLAAAYQKTLQKAVEPEELKQEQRDWLYNKRNLCQDFECLRQSYEERLKALAVYNEQQRVKKNSEPCAFTHLKLPDSYSVFAAGGYSGRELDFQIDQSGHQATQMDVIVNYSSKPAVLMLGSYEPTIWNIKWTPTSRIVAVLVSGYHRQAVAGLDPAVPLLNTSQLYNGNCVNFYIGEHELEKLNPISHRFFGCSVDMVYQAKNGEIVIGDAVPKGSKLITSQLVTPESFFDKTEPLAGPAGLEQAVRKGLIRKATDADADAWVNAETKNKHHKSSPPIAGEKAPKAKRPANINAYVILKPFTYPAGLYGGNLATFFIPKGVPQPKGNPGHSTVYDFNKLTCTGVLCN